MSKFREGEIKMRIHSMLLGLSFVALSGCSAAPGEESEQPSGTTGAVEQKIVACQIAIRTQNGNYLTAVGGGGRRTNAIHSDATSIGSWEMFAVSPFIETKYFETSNGHLLTAVGGGGRTTDVIHTDAIHAGDWEYFTIEDAGGGTSAIRTFDGHYLTAVGGGGRTTDVLHTDATSIGSWEQFTIEAIFCT
jgi:hypothetical protein